MRSMDDTCHTLDIQQQSSTSETIAHTNIEAIRDSTSKSDLEKLQALLLSPSPSTRCYSSIAVDGHSRAHLGDVYNYSIHMNDSNQVLLLQELEKKIASLEQKTLLQADVGQSESRSHVEDCKSYNEVERRFLKRRHSQGHEPSPRHPVSSPGTSEDAPQYLKILLDSLRSEYAPMDTLVIRESIAARRRRAPGPILEEASFLPILNDWLRAPDSAICTLQHNLVLQDHAKDLVVEVIRHLVKSDLPTVWNLEISNTLELTPAEKIGRVLAYQLLQLHIENTKQSSLAGLSVEKKWFETLSDILDVTTRCFIVVEMPISNDDSSAIQYGELVTVLQRAIRRSNERAHVLKVLILTGNSIDVLQRSPDDSCNISCCKLRNTFVPAARMRVALTNQGMPLSSKLKTPVLDSSGTKGPKTVTLCAKDGVAVTAAA